MDAEQFFEVRVGGISRRLPIRAVSPQLSIAFVQLLGDVAFCEAVAVTLVALAPEPPDVIVTPELKGIVLAHEIARLTGRPYVVLRKQQRVYMTGSTSVPVQSVTGDAGQRLWLSGDDAASLTGRRVWLVDDVVTTGASLAATRTLVEGADGQVVDQLAAFTEGAAAAARRDVRAAGHLPLFDPTGQPAD